MDMSMSNGEATSSSVASMMTPYLHFTGGDHLYFKSLTPSSSGAIAGAAIVLLLFAILERALSAGRGVMEARWRQAALTMTAARLGLASPATAEAECTDCKEGDATPPTTAASLPSATPLVTSRAASFIVPFIVSHDLSRGALYSLQALLAYALMLAVMTFQAAYIIAIVAGLGLGEMMFGRFALAYAHL